MRALQALVIVMGILLLAGSAVIAVTIMHRMSAGTLHAHPAIGSPAIGLPAHVDVALPSGAQIVTSFALGDRVAIQVKLGGADAVLIVDPASGAIVETMSLVPQPSPQP